MSFEMSPFPLASASGPPSISSGLGTYSLKESSTWPPSLNKGRGHYGFPGGVNPFGLPLYYQLAKGRSRWRIKGMRLINNPHINKLRPYQREVALAILDSVFGRKGLTFSVELARQGG